MVRDDESSDFWMAYPKDDLALRCAVLHRQRRELQESLPPKEVEIFRRTLSELFIKGVGIEVGAGTRPFPLPSGARCFYGDVRDRDGLVSYFSTDAVQADRIIDAQTFRGIEDASFDFVVSAHVIEHLEDPIGNIVQAMRILKPGGVYVLIVPDMRFTFDRLRPPTPVEHVVADHRDGGAGTRLEAYREFMTHVAGPIFERPVAEADIPAEAERCSAQRLDIHFHAWTTETFLELLTAARGFAPFELVGHSLAVNENGFVLKKP